MFPWGLLGLLRFRILDSGLRAGRRGSGSARNVCRSFDHGMSTLRVCGSGPTQARKTENVL